MTDIERIEAEIKRCIHKHKDVNTVFEQGRRDALRSTLAFIEPILAKTESPELSEAFQIYSDEHPYESRYNLFKAGAEWQKKQIEKEAVEGSVVGDWRNQEEDPYALYIVSDELVSTKYKIGDAVKLIVLKDEEYADK